jgi:hypothetical protein
MEHKYEIGQNVYVAKNLRGWFDCSVQEFIPENTPCTIQAIHYDWDRLESRYYVRFNGKVKEFGHQLILESSLKLG